MNPKHPVIGPVVYYVRTRGRIKIGHTVNLRQRLNQYRPEALLAVEPGSRTTETERHEQFAASRIDRRSKWFRPGPALDAHIVQLAAASPPPVDVLVPRHRREPGRKFDREHVRRIRDDR